MIKVILLVLALVGCSPRVIDLGGDKPDAAIAAVDAPSSACRCRITPCRSASDCTASGGTCGADFYCTGDFGACTTTAQCQTTVTASVCTVSATSTLACQ